MQQNNVASSFFVAVGQPMVTIMSSLSLFVILLPRLSLQVHRLFA